MAKKRLPRRAMTSRDWLMFKTNPNIKPVRKAEAPAVPEVLDGLPGESLPTEDNREFSIQDIVKIHTMVVDVLVGGEPLKVEYLGERLCNAEASEEGGWLFGASQEAKVSNLVKADVQCNVVITKVDSEKRLVYGIVLEPDEVDAHNDTIGEEVIEEAAHAFLANYNRETQLGLMHRLFGNIGVALAQSYIAPSDLKMGGQDVKRGSWLMVVKVIDDNVWKKIKAGEITGFSIGGLATMV